MLAGDEYLISLFAAFVHLRVFAFELQDDCLLKDDHRFVMKVSDRVPHLEYFYILDITHGYKRVGAKLRVRALSHVRCCIDYQIQYMSRSENETL
jgi:hypothetical protein